MLLVLGDLQTTLYVPNLMLGTMILTFPSKILKPIASTRAGSLLSGDAG